MENEQVSRNIKCQSSRVGKAFANDFALVGSFINDEEKRVCQVNSESGVMETHISAGEEVGAGTATEWRSHSAPRRTTVWSWIDGYPRSGMVAPVPWASGGSAREWALENSNASRRGFSRESCCCDQLNGGIQPELILDAGTIRFDRVNSEMESNGNFAGC